MNGSYLLDTNIVIALFARDSGVANGLAAATAVYLPSIVLGELHFGARRSARAEANIARIENFRARNIVLNVETATAEHYGQIKNTLRLKGRPIPENDIWIAALAVQHQLTLVTRDAHFRAIATLSLEHW